MRYFDAFAGYGGFSLGIKRAYESLHSQSENERLQDEGNITGSDGLNVQGATCVGYSEINKYAIETYSKHFPEHKNYGDLTKINAEELPDFDLFVGGFPCQAFSIAGKRKGFDDTRGTLFFDIARILRAKRPRLLLLENVKGLLSHDNGKTFSTIISTLDEIGYDLQWQVLNAKHFGVPQNRERVFIVGHLRGTSRPQVFPIAGDNTETTVEGLSTISAVTGIKGVNKAPTLDTMYMKGLGSKQARPGVVQLNKPTHSNDKVYGDSGLSPTLNTMQGGNRQPFVAAVLTPDRLEKRQNGRRFKENGEPSFTLNTQDRHGIYDGVKIRRLTPTECERLMGLPDGWTEGVSDTQRYKLCGNGVVVNVVEEIVKRILLTR